jgi:hypothetical protein
LAIAYAVFNPVENVFLTPSLPHANEEEKQGVGSKE